MLLKNASKRVVVLLRDRVELVIVASRARARESQKYGSSGIGAILDVHHSHFFFDDAVFTGCRVVAIKTAGDQLVERGIWQEIPSELFDDELVVGEVAVKRLNHPVAIRPHLAIVVVVETIGIGITGGIQPIMRAMFAKVLGSQQPINQLRVGVIRFIVDESLDLFDGGGQPGQIQSHAADQLPLVRLGRWL